jgi:hypothetical protein
LHGCPVIECLRRLRLFHGHEELRNAVGGEHADDHDHDGELNEGEPFAGLQSRHETLQGVWLATRLNIGKAKSED